MRIIEILLAVWSTPGLSEFAAALLGGSITIVAQYVALRHDSKRQQAQHDEARKANAWAVFFKISESDEALAATASVLRSARTMAHAQAVELWQVLQFPPHDWNPVRWEINELVFLVDQKQFGLMQRYQESIMWLSNLVQSTKYYRELRVEFLRSVPAHVEGDHGQIEVGPENHSILMPTIAHLRTLAESLENVVLAQAQAARTLRLDFAAAMEQMIGHKPKLEFPSQG